MVQILKGAAWEEWPRLHTEQMTVLKKANSAARYFRV
jgi:hypothetical protein